MQNSVTAPNASSAWLQKLALHPIIQKIFNAKHIPLLYSVIVVTSIFYHYGAAYTPLWFLLGLVLQCGAFKLLHFVKKHHLLGGALYVIVCVFTFLSAGLCITVGGDHTAFGGIFAPVGTDVQLSFMVWFLTPQSVINAFYGPYTVALFLLFTLFIATVVYYYSHVIYRTLMSFSVMCFPFAIYAKESEVMPVPFIVALFVMYFVVMIYCKQLHCGDQQLMHIHDPNATDYALPEPEILCNAKIKELTTMPRPELFGKGIWMAALLFITAATILVLILPKPTITADRSYLDTLLDTSSFADYLLSAISGFNDSSDGGNYSALSSSQALYYVETQESLNLRLSTYTYYDYATDSWSAAYLDGHSDYYDLFYDTPSTLMMKDLIAEYDRNDLPYYLSENASATPYDYYMFFCMVEEAYPALAEEYGFAGISKMQLSLPDYKRSMVFHTPMYNGTNYMAPLHTYMVASKTRYETQLYQAKNGLFFRTDPAIIRMEEYSLQYLSPTMFEDEAMQFLTQQLTIEEVLTLAVELAYSMDTYANYPDLNLFALFLNDEISNALYYSQDMIGRETPERVTELATTLTEGLTTDFEKANAIRNYLYTFYTYDADYLISDTDNVETFLFENRTGVCYQFASAMTELCRAAGLYARYVEGFALAEETNSTRYPNANYVIRAKHAHAFTEVYIAGYGWLSMDATAADLNESPDLLAGAEDIISTLQRTGIILLIFSAVIVLLSHFLLPILAEQHFRRVYRKRKGLAMMSKAYTRLQKQWQTPSAATIREVCAQMQPLFAYDQQAEAALSQLQTTLEQGFYGECYTDTLAMECYWAYCTLRSAYRTCTKQQQKQQSAVTKVASQQG